MNTKLTFSAILILLLSAIIVSCGSDKKSKEFATHKEVKKIPTQVTDTTPPSSSTEIEATTQDAEKEGDTKEPEAPQKYFLIKGSFEIKANAEKLAAKLNKEGFDTRIIPTDFGMYRVSCKGFSNRSEAFKNLKEERAAGKDIWLNITPED